MKITNAFQFHPSAYKEYIAGKFFNDQLNEWNLAAQNYAALKYIKTKEINFGSYSIRVQFNPARIRSSAAKTDSSLLNTQICFLCSHNLPPAQRSLPFGENYQILVNPYPIFPIHFTIPAVQHTPQLIACRYGDMLDIAQQLERFVIFYNGPRCGASIPGHAHFQAGNRGFLPLEKDLKTVPQTEIACNSKIRIYTLKNYQRNILTVESYHKSEMEHIFGKICIQLKTAEGEKEPMLNIITWFEDGKWTSSIFCRTAHRPACFFSNGEAHRLISPGAVDMGGVIITPRKDDFNRTDRESITQILKEVCCSDEINYISLLNELQ